MEFLSDVVAWFADADHWRGSAGIPNRLFEHVQLSAFAIASAVLLALPTGALLGHLRRGGLIAINVVNIGRAIPSFAIVAIALPVTINLGLGFGFWPTWLAVFLLALPPIFTNAYTAIRNADPDAVSAALAMGLRSRDVLFDVELPLAAPLMIAATRVAAVQVVATAPLGALVGWGGLGRFIVDGLAVRDFAQVFAGALLVAVLAVGTELGFTLAERLLLPTGVRRLTSATFAAKPI
jgi:osmoprotectant transport system permease protein